MDCPYFFDFSWHFTSRLMLFWFPQFTGSLAEAINFLLCRHLLHLSRISLLCGTNGSSSICIKGVSTRIRPCRQENEGGELSMQLSQEKDQQERQNEQREPKAVIQTSPELVKGINLIRKPENLPVFQALVAKELEGKNSSAVWIDAKNESSTYAISSIGSQELLEKVHIGRAFTPFQHNELIRGLEEFIMEDTEVLVLPNVTFLYEDGQANEWEAKELFESAWSKIKEFQRNHDLKVITSLPAECSTFNHILEVEKDNEIEVKPTDSGLKYDSKSYEHLVYHDSGSLQTTIPFWNRKTRENSKLRVKH